jgi:hydrogenase-4 component B
MFLLLLPAALALCIGFLSFVLRKWPRCAHLTGAAGMAVAGALGLGLTIAALLRGESFTLTAEWNAAIGASFSVGFDSLSGLFLLPIYGLSAVCAVFGYGYMAHEGRRLGAHWLFYGVLTACMAVVVIARNAVLFLVAWELMSLSSWLLVTYEHDREETRQAGITYLVATQIGTAFLLVMFLLLGSTGKGLSSSAQSVLDFSNFSGISGAVAGAAFLLALVGFGTKAGIVPFHVWLPEAHPAAPSHVSALMSGVMIKVGIYGIVRVLTFLGAPPTWWGWTLTLVGAVSAILGVIFALAQHDIKRLLAYHSVENIGIICMGLGIGLLGLAYGAPAVAVLGFAGGLLHVINHALFKGLLFLGAGAAAKATGTREMDRLGGLLRRMPMTGLSFLIAAIAICGLPPLNGFVSELLVFAGGLRAVLMPRVPQAVAAALAVAALAFASGLAAACFTKAFGVMFLGEPRSPQAGAAKEAGASMVAPLLLLAASCVIVGLLGWLAVDAVAPLASSMSGVSLDDGRALLAPLVAGLAKASVVAGALAAAALGLAGLRSLLLRRRSVRQSGTWDCGYGVVDARMQYTSSSFAQPLVGMFHGLLGTHTRWKAIADDFPASAAFATETPDALSKRVFNPALSWIGALFSRLRWLQHGRLQVYVLYIAITLLIVLLWRLA